MPGVPARRPATRIAAATLCRSNIVFHSSAYTPPRDADSRCGWIPRSEIRREQVVMPQRIRPRRGTSALTFHNVSAICNRMVALMNRVAARRNEGDKLVTRPLLVFASKFIGAIAFLAALAASSGLAHAVDIKCLWPNELRPVLADVIPQFQRATGHRVKAEWGSSEEVARRLDKGEAVDVVIVAAPEADELRKEGRIVAGSRREIGKVGVGVLVCKGESKPDISSVEAFKQSLLAT